MKKNYLYILLISIFFFSYLSYSYAILHNSILFIVLFRVIFPILMMGTVYFARRIYSAKNSLANLLWGSVLILPAGVVSLFLIMGLQLPGFGIILPFGLSVIVIMLFDMLGRWLGSKAFVKFSSKKFFAKSIMKDSQMYYALLLLIYVSTVASLTVMF